MRVEEMMRAGLHEATDNLQPSVGLLPSVLRRSRQRRIRTGIAMSAAVAVLVAGGVTAGLLHKGTQQAAANVPLSPTDQQLLHGKTTGNLAGDKAYLQQAKDLVLDWVRKQEPIDRIKDSKQGYEWTDYAKEPEPHVVWAGNTKDGKAAIVAQQAYRRDADYSIPKAPEREHYVATLAFIGPGANDAPKLMLSMSQQYRMTTTDGTAGFFVKKSGRTVVLVQAPTTTYMSFGSTRTADEQSRRTYVKTPFVSGIAVVGIPDSAQPEDFITSETPGDPKHISTLVNTPGPEMIGTSTDGTMQWPAALWQVGSKDAFWPPADKPAFGVKIDDLDRSYDYLDVNDRDAKQGGSWTIYGTLPNGSHIVVTDIKGAKEQQPHTIATVTPPKGKYSLVVGAGSQENSPLPVQLKLPGGQGWVVAQRDATLSYRVGNGAWQDVQHNAALYPATATAVRVQDSGKTSVVSLGK